MTIPTNGSDATIPDPYAFEPGVNVAPTQSASPKERAADVASTGKQAAGEVAQTATDAAKDVVHETKQQAGDLVGKTKSQLSQQAGTQKGALVENLRSLGDQLAAMTDHVDESGTAIDVASRARDQARDAADWLDDHEPNDILDELRRLGRRQPGRFLGGALLAGVVAGRLTRGVVAVHTDDGTADAAPSASDTGAPATRPVTPPVARHGVDAGSTPVGGLVGRDTNDASASTLGVRRP